MFTQIRDSDNVSDVLCVRLCIYNPNLDSIDRSTRIWNRQRSHRIVVLISEILRKEIVTIRFVIICAYIKILRLCATLNFDLLAFTLLLRKYCRIVELAPLRLELHTEETLRPRNECPLEGKRDVSRFNILEYIVFLTLKTDVHLVFEIEQRFCVILRPKFNLIPDFTRDI